MPKPTATPERLTRFERVLSHFSEVEKNCNGYMALCPAHDDNSPSLSLREGRDGRTFVKCFAGCESEEVIRAVGLTDDDIGPPTYIYEDEEGKPLYRVQRGPIKDGRKSFYQHRYEDGAWVKGTKGVRKVLYRFPELLANRGRKTIYVTEGEKDADRLRELGLIATTNAGGANAKWLREFSEVLRGARVVVLPDNDKPGRQRVEKIARQLVEYAKSVKVILLPGLPEKGDISDWLDAGRAKAELLALVKTTPPRLIDGSTGRRDDPTDEPSRTVADRSTDAATGQNTSGTVEPSSRRTVASVEPFPVDALPACLRDFVTSMSEAMNCPVDYPGAYVLGFVSGLIGRSRHIRLKDSWKESPALWIAVVGPSGQGKSPPFDLISEPVWTIQRQLDEKFRKAMDEWEANDREGSPPREQQIITSDATIEALKRVLESNPRGVLFGVDELAGWARAMSQYKGGRGDDRQAWLSIWSGSAASVNRVSQPRVTIYKPFVGVVGGIQPDALADLIDLRREDGFAARILFSYPDPLPPPEWTDDSVRCDETYAKLCYAIRDDEQPQTHSLNDDAKALWVEWYNRHNLEPHSDRLRPVYAKAKSYCARLALVLHVVRLAAGETTSKQIDSESMAGAVKLIEYFKSHAQRVYGLVVDNKSGDRIAKAVAWIKDHGEIQKDGSYKTTKKKIQQHRVAGVRDGDEAGELLEDLAEMGHGESRNEARNSTAFYLRDGATGRPSDGTEVHDA